MIRVGCAEWMSQGGIEKSVYCTYRLDGIRNQVAGRKPDDEQQSIYMMFWNV